MSDRADLGSVLVLRCEDCGHEEEGDERELIMKALDDEAECPDCGGLFDLVEVFLADELEAFTAACRDLDESCAMLVERKPSLKPRVEAMLAGFKAEIDAVLGAPL